MEELRESHQTGFPSQYIPNLCLICTCRRAGPNPLVDLPRHGSFSVQIFTSFGVQVLCSDFAVVLDTLVLTPASYKKLKFSLYALPSNMAAPALHLADNRFPTNSLPPRSLHSDLSDVQWLPYSSFYVPVFQFSFSPEYIVKYGSEKPCTLQQTDADLAARRPRETKNTWRNQKENCTCTQNWWIHLKTSVW